MRKLEATSPAPGYSVTPVSSSLAAMRTTLVGDAETKRNARILGAEGLGAVHVRGRHRHELPNQAVFSLVGLGPWPLGRRCYLGMNCNDDDVRVECRPAYELQVRRIGPLEETLTTSDGDGEGLELEMEFVNEIVLKRRAVELTGTGAQLCTMPKLRKNFQVDFDANCVSRSGAAVGGGGLSKQASRGPTRCGVAFSTSLLTINAPEPFQASD